jgi:hypothetical protein
MKRKELLHQAAAAQRGPGAKQRLREESTEKRSGRMTVAGGSASLDARDCILRATKKALQHRQLCALNLAAFRDK